MNLRLHATLTASALLLLAGCATAPPDAATLIQRAEQTLKGGGSQTVAISGNGTGTTFGQAWQPTLGWPGLNYAVLKRSYNLQTGAFREEFGRSRSEPNGGGATPLMGQGEARATGFTRDGFSWNAAGTGTAPNPVSLLVQRSLMRPGKIGRAHV